MAGPEGPAARSALAAMARRCIEFRVYVDQPAHPAFIRRVLGLRALRGPRTQGESSFRKGFFALEDAASQTSRPTANSLGWGGGGGGPTTGNPTVRVSPAGPKRGGRHDRMQIDHDAHRPEYPRLQAAGRTSQGNTWERTAVRAVTCEDDHGPSVRPARKVRPGRPSNPTGRGHKLKGRRSPRTS
jgi:hypothetical protein